MTPMFGDIYNESESSSNSSDSSEEWFKKARWFCLEEIMNVKNNKRASM